MQFAYVHTHMDRYLSMFARCNNLLYSIDLCVMYVKCT
jgi:hypothetical protein